MTRTPNRLARTTFPLHHYRRLGGTDEQSTSDRRQDGLTEGTMMGLHELMTMDQVSPAEWGADLDYDSRPRDDTNQIFIHWTGTAVPQDVADGDVDAEMKHLRGIEAYHQRKGWAGIAYDWAVGNSGTLYRCRGDAKSAATGGDIDLDQISNNSEAEAILVLVGQGQTASAECQATLSRVCSILGYDELYGHRESSERGSGTATSCPGDQLMEWVRQYRNTWEEGHKPAPAKPAPKPSTSTTTEETGFENMRLLKNQKPMLKGTDVKAAQTLLNLHGAKLKVDGYYGDNTEKAVKAFQKKAGVGVDGIVGPNTRRELNGG